MHESIEEDHLASSQNSAAEIWLNPQDTSIIEIQETQEIGVHNRDHVLDLDQLDRKLKEVTPDFDQLPRITADDDLAHCISFRNEIISLGCIPSRAVNTFEDASDVPPSPSAVEAGSASYAGEVIFLPERSAWEPVAPRLTLISFEMEFWDRQLDMWHRFLRHRERIFKVREEDGEEGLAPPPSPSGMDRCTLLAECCDYLQYNLDKPISDESHKERWTKHLNDFAPLLEEAQKDKARCGERSKAVEEEHVDPPKGDDEDGHHEQHLNTDQDNGDSPQNAVSVPENDGGKHSTKKEAESGTTSRGTTPLVLEKRARSEEREDDQSLPPTKKAHVVQST